MRWFCSYLGGINPSKRGFCAVVLVGRDMSRVLECTDRNRVIFNTGLQLCDVPRAGNEICCCRQLFLPHGAFYGYYYRSERMQIRISPYSSSVWILLLYVT